MHYCGKFNYYNNALLKYGIMIPLRKIAISIVLMICQFSINAQVVGFEAIVSDYGQLKMTLGENWDKVDSLAVKGPINYSDFNTIWECAFFGNLSILNLENAQIEYNRIPDNALCDMNRQYWEVGGKTIYLGIKKIILPDNIVEIGRNAFNYMELEYINLPKSLRKLNQYSFANCHWLKVDPLIIPEGITEIPGQCFVNCQSFRELILPSTLRTICDLAFYNTRMEEVQFPCDLDSIGFAAFSESILLQKAILPDNCHRLGGFVFNHCIRLKKLKIPNGIQKVPNSFAGLCDSLEVVNFSGTVTEIGSSAFDGNSKLRNFKFPNNLEVIGHSAFYSCKPDSVVFPKSLKYLGGASCKNWNNVQKIYSMALVPPYCEEDNENPGNYSFGGSTPRDIPIYVPIGTAELYRNAQGWNYFNNFIEIDKFPNTGVYGAKLQPKEDFVVYWADGTLYIELIKEMDDPIPFAVFSIDGRLIKNGYINEPNFALPIPKNIYVVQIGKLVYKVR